MSNLAVDIAGHLALREFEGYIQVVNLIGNKAIKVGNFKYSNLQDIEKFIDEFELYYTPNPSYNGKRGVDNLKQLRSLYLDFDIRNKRSTRDDINHVIYEIWLIANKGEIPRPTKALVTGRGVHIYWEIEPSSYGALGTWQELEDYLYNKLKHLGADKQATDAARLMRLEGTINSKTGTRCELYVFEENNIYSMYELREQYLNWNSKNEKTMVKGNRNTRKVINFFTSYSLHMARAEDIVTLLELRNYEVEGYRNFILHCYAYWKGIYVRNDDELRELVYELNNKFKAPLKETEVNAILRCIPKAIDKFLEYEQGLRCGKCKRVSKNMRDKGGYWYKNETIINRLDITQEEMKHLKTIISTTVKNKRFYEANKEDYKEKNKNANRARRRNENGLTQKQQEIEELRIKITELQKDGLSLRKIAKSLNKSLGSIQNALKSNKILKDKRKIG